MNILPKKRWHVRTKENIARVRKDEAEAAEKEREENLRIENADREARLNVLKQRSKQKLFEQGIEEPKEQEGEVQITEHINFFTDSDHAVKHTNKEHDRELKEKKEEYEKKIGYLTYLGQDTNEALKKKNWYELLPNSRFAQSSTVKDTYEKLVLKDKDGKPMKKELDEKDGELDWKAKQSHDPIKNYKKYCTGKQRPLLDTHKLGDDRIKHNHSKKNKKTKEDDKKKTQKELKLKLLREARLKREQHEKHRTDLFLSGINKPAVTTDTSVNKVKAKYNSQFNPELARQNYSFK